jgi:predicted nucleotidyltransferase
VHPIIEKHSAELADLCRRFHVQRLDLFGSATTGRFDPATSDLDFLVEYEPMAPELLVDSYFGLLEALEVLFQRSVDLVSARAIRNPYFAESVEATRQPVYVA